MSADPPWNAKADIFRSPGLNTWVSPAANDIMALAEPFICILMSWLGEDVPKLVICTNVAKLPYVPRTSIILSANVSLYTAFK